MTEVFESGYDGLASAQTTLPADWYRSPAHHERELDRIWRRSWLYIGRADRIPPLTFRTVRIIGQSVLVVRDGEGALHAFHNSCRHRGSRLCSAEEGRLDKRRITCPYHQWSYALDGRLISTGHSGPIAGFDRRDFPLLSVAVAEHRGGVFANLAGGEAPPLEHALGEEMAPLANWPLEELAVGHRYTRRLGCNWKVFWENFNECLHCPNVHPSLSELVPIYGRAIMARRDDPDWQAHADDDTPEYAGTLRAGAESWTTDGRALPPLPGPTDAERAAGQTYAVAMPSLFMVGHTDYVRTVRLLPLGPEETELTAEWLLPQHVLAEGRDLRPVIDFATQVIEEDGAVCELNQQGLANRAFQAGVLMREEYEVLAFQDWVRRQLGESPVAEAASSRASRRAR